MPKDKSAPSGSCVYQVLFAGGTLEAIEYWDMGGLKGSCRVEAFSVPPKNFEEDIPRIVALVRPQSQGHKQDVETKTI